MSKPGNMWRKVHGKITKKPTNFSWLIEEKLAGSGIPTTLDEFDWLLNQGVKSIVTMTENALPGEWTQKIDYLHVPTADFHAPDMEGIDSAVEFIQTQIQNDQIDLVVQDLLTLHYDPTYFASMKRNFEHIQNAQTLHARDRTHECLTSIAQEIIGS